MLGRSCIAVWTQLVSLCLAVPPASIAQSLAQATPSLLTFGYNNTSPLATLAAITPTSFPRSYIIKRSDPQVILQIDHTVRHFKMSVVSVTRAIFQGMDEIVRDMKSLGGDGPIPRMEYIMIQDDVVVDVYADEQRGAHFTRSIAETVLRGTWDLFADFEFSSVDMKVFLGSQAKKNQIGGVVIKRA